MQCYPNTQFVDYLCKGFRNGFDTMVKCDELKNVEWNHNPNQCLAFRNWNVMLSR
jgi:hypothetical protein